MCRKRQRPQVPRASPLTVAQILTWADAYHDTTGKWPCMNSGRIAGASGENWRRVDSALRLGLRGLSGRSSLARLLAEERGVRNLTNVPPLTPEQILAWADAHQQRTGKWPNEQSGPVAGTPGETWHCLDRALRAGVRGLPSESSLARLLAERRGVRNLQELPSLTPEQILAWADAHQQRTGNWPDHLSGPVAEAPGVAWATVEKVLRRGLVGRPAGWTLARFLAEERQVRCTPYLRPLTVEQILAWADAHRRRTGRWPIGNAGNPVADAPGETWKGLDSALRWSGRGLPGGSSLAKLLAAQRGVPNMKCPTPLTVEQILAWADRHHERIGRWPTSKSGPIAGTEGETWLAVDLALRQARRDLPYKSSLALILTEHRKGGRRLNREPLTLPQILSWADEYYRRYGRWPNGNSGRIRGTRGESWKAVDQALRNGYRTLPGKSSLHLLLEKHRRIAEAGLQASSTAH